MRSCSLLLSGGLVADSRGELGHVDIALDGNTLLDIGPNLHDTYDANRCMDVKGKWVLPGVVDPHVHLSKWFGCAHGHRALVAAGVTTAVDFAGPVEDVLSTAELDGAGLELGIMEALTPRQLDSGVPTAVDRALEKGALGVKILGGHFPLSPDQVREVGELTARRRDYLFALHAGTTAHPGDFSGLTEAIDLVSDLPVYLAHLNSYCRGEVTSDLEETQQALRWVDEHQILTESYLGIINGCPGEVDSGKLVSAATRRHLRRLRFDDNPKGLAEALNTGAAQAVDPSAVGQLRSGPSAVDYWDKAKSMVTVCFPINKLSVGVAMLTARTKYDPRAFSVSNICSDGGGIPRNVTLEYGLRLVEWRVLSIGELITKCSLNPGRLLGMDKGTFSPGADADVVIADRLTGLVDATIGGGQILYENGKILGSGARILVRQESSVSTGLPTRQVDLAKSTLFIREPGLTR